MKEPILVPRGLFSGTLAEPDRTIWKREIFLSLTTTFFLLKEGSTNKKSDLNLLEIPGFTGEIRIKFF